MGRKSGERGNAYKNPVEGYRKRLGKNEANPTSMGHRMRGSRHKPSSQRELAKARRLPKNWKSIVVWGLVLLAIVGGLFAVMTLEAGKYALSYIFYGSN